MAKIAFSKLNAKVNTDIKTITICEDKEIEIRQYLPVQDKLILAGEVIAAAHDPNNNFANPLKTEVYFILNLFMKYTNISFTEKQKEDPAKLYDMIVNAEWYADIINAIPETEIIELRDTIIETQTAFYNYRTSLLGLLETVQTEYSNMDLDISDLQQKIANGEGIELVKKVIDNLV